MTGEHQGTARDPRVGPDPEVDVTVAVSNPELRSAIVDFESRRAPDSEEALHVALARALYLNPATFHPPLEVRPDGTATTEVETAVAYMHYPTGQEGAFSLALFTDWDALRAADPGATNAQILLAIQAFTLALATPGGAVVNPGSTAPFLVPPAMCAEVAQLLGLIEGGKD
jgi:hypothetical protein